MMGRWPTGSPIPATNIPRSTMCWCRRCPPCWPWRLCARASICPRAAPNPARSMWPTTLPEGLILDGGTAKGVWLRIVLREGKKRQIRHVTPAPWAVPQRLVRWAIGPVTVEGVKPGRIPRPHRHRGRLPQGDDLRQGQRKPAHAGVGPAPNSTRSGRPLHTLWGQHRAGTMNEVGATSSPRAKINTKLRTRTNWQ